MTFEDSIHQAPGWSVLFVSSLVVLECCATCGGLDSLVNLWKWWFAWWACLWDGSQTAVFRSFSLLKSFDLHDHFLVILEIRAVKCLKRWVPNGKLGSKGLVLSLVGENWVARVLHQVQVLNRWASGCKLSVDHIFGGKLVITHWAHLKLWKDWQGVDWLNVVVVKD